MSAIHNALSQATQPNSSPRDVDFNPLEIHESNTATKWKPLLFALSCAFIALAIVYWPKQTNISEAFRVLIGQSKQVGSDAATLSPLINNSQNEQSTQSGVVADKVQGTTVESIENHTLTPPLKNTVSPLEIAASDAANSDLNEALQTSTNQNSKAKTTEAKVTSNSEATGSGTVNSSTIDYPSVNSKSKPEATPRSNTNRTANSVTSVNAKSAEGNIASVTAAKNTSSTSNVTSTNAIKNKDSAVSSHTNSTVNSNNTTALNSIIQSSKNEWQLAVEKHIQNDDIEKAEAVLKQWIGAAPKDNAPRIWLARIYINNKFYKAAEPLLNGVDSEAAMGLLGLIFERTNRHNLAAKQFETLYRNNPQDGKWLLFWAINTENNKQLAKSTTLYQNYLNSFTDDSPSLRKFAQQRLKVLGD